jgi:hypothetical protein
MTDAAAATLKLEHDAMRAARVEDHRLCAKLAEDNTALVEKVAFLGDRLAACNRDIGQLSAALEEARDILRAVQSSGWCDERSEMMKRIALCLPASERT